MTRKDRLEKATKNFIAVRDYFLNEDRGTSRAYRLAWKKPYKFYREHTPVEAVEILKREADRANTTEAEFLFKEAMAALQCLAEENPPDSASYLLEENRAKILGYIEDNGDNDRWIALVLEIYGETFEYIEYGTDEVDKTELADKVREILNDYNERRRK